MFVVRCPSCGAPNAACLATPDRIACSACGYVGTPPPDAGRQLQAAAAVLAGVDVRERQLSEQQRKALGRARRGASRVASILMLALLPLTPCALCSGVFLIGENRSIPLFIMCVSPFLFLGMTGGTVVLWLRRRRRVLEAACAAVPPAVEGGPARCHVCGGDLAAPALDAGGLVRCGYCQADNLVDPKVLARLGDRRVHDVSRFEEAVRAQSRQLGLESGLAFGVVLVLGLLAPTLCIASAWGTDLLARKVERPANTERTYQLIQLGEGACVAYLQGRYDDGTGYLMVARPPSGTRGANYVQGAGVEGFPASWLVGRWVRVQDIHRQWHVGVVRRIHGTLLDRNNHLVIEEHGVELSERVSGACLEEGAPPGQTVFPWPEVSTTPRGAKRLD